MNDITPVLEKLAAKLGTTVEHFWPLFVYQQKINAIVALAILALSFLVLGSAWAWAFYKVNKTFWGNGRDDFPKYAWGEFFDDYPWFVVVAILTIITFTASLFVSVESITALLNPEYAAIQDLLRMVK